MGRDADAFPDFYALDEFGVPANLLGRHPDELYGLIARIVMLTALLEDRQRTLLASLTLTGEEAYASKPATKVIELLQTAGAEAAALRPEWGALTELLNRTAEHLAFRHGVVHNLWPAQPGGGVFGHRLVARTKERTGFTFTMDDIRAAVLTVVDLIAETESWLNRASEIAYLRRRAGADG